MSSRRFPPHGRKWWRVIYFAGANNMRTAKALGLTIPVPLLGRVDEVMD
jgi:hypothetical protein